MSLEFEIWPSAAVQRYASSAQAAARRGRTIDATDVRAVEQQARAEFPSWDASDVVSFVEHVLRTADLEVATAPSPPTAVQARRQEADIITAVPRHRTAEGVQSSAEDVDWSKPSQILVVGDDLSARYVVCDEDGVAGMIDVRTLREFAETDRDFELGTWRVVGEGQSTSLELVFGSRELRTHGPSFHATERETSITVSSDSTTARRPFIVLPVISELDIPSTGAGLQRMLLTFPPERIVGTLLLSANQAMEYRLDASPEEGVTPVQGKWHSSVRDIFERGTRCLIIVGAREWVGTKIPESGLMSGTETYHHGAPAHVMGVTALVPRSVVEDFHGAFLLDRAAESPPPALPSQPFWALAHHERDVHDEQGNPAFRIGPTAWALVIEDRGSVFVIRHEDGRIGFLHDTSGVTRG